MDTSVVPAIGSWSLIINSAPFAVSGFAWDDPTTLRITAGGVAQPLTDTNITLDVADPNLRSADLQIAQPQGPIILIP